jgi:RNA polymerase sigma factor (sigma-70 family)
LDRRSSRSSSLSELMAAAQAGDAAAYRALLEDARRWLARYFARRLPPSVVDDAVQDALIAVHEKRHTYDPARPFEPWLAAIARYKCVDRLRAMRRSAEVPMSPEIAAPDRGDAVDGALALERLLSALKPAQAEAIRLVKLHGLSVEEASAQTGQSVSLVKVNIHRGLGRIAKFLAGGRDVE